MFEHFFIEEELEGAYLLLLMYHIGMRLLLILMMWFLLLICRLTLQFHYLFTNYPDACLFCLYYIISFDSWHEKTCLVYYSNNTDEPVYLQSDQRHCTVIHSHPTLSSAKI